MEIEEIDEILASRDFGRLVGAEENVVLEVKSMPYDLTESAQQRYELAKDVSSLANSQGGYLIVGLRTERAPEKQVDVVASLSLVPAAVFPAERYTGVIREHVEPEIKGLEVIWLAANGGTDGLGIIFVPPQAIDDKPFIIAKVVDDDQYLKAIVVGYAERRGASNDPFTRSHLRRTLKHGQDTQSQRLTRMEQKIDELLDRDRQVEARQIPAAPTFDIDALERRINAVVRDLPE